MTPRVELYCTFFHTYNTKRDVERIIFLSICPSKNCSNKFLEDAVLVVVLARTKNAVIFMPILHRLFRSTMISGFISHKHLVTGRLM